MRHGGIPWSLESGSIQQQRACFFLFKPLELEEAIANGAIYFAVWISGCDENMTALSFGKVLVKSKSRIVSIVDDQQPRFLQVC
jgi:hypothetical protein